MPVLIWGFFFCLEVKPSDLRFKEKKKVKLTTGQWSVIDIFLFLFWIASRIQTYSVHNISFHLHNRLSTTCTLRCCLAGYAFHQKGKFSWTFKQKRKNIRFFSNIFSALENIQCNFIYWAVFTLNATIKCDEAFPKRTHWEWMVCCLALFFSLFWICLHNFTH